VLQVPVLNANLPVCCVYMAHGEGKESEGGNPGAEEERRRALGGEEEQHDAMSHAVCSG
jgi:hypothetical protein